MTDLKAFLTGTEATETELKIYSERLERINQELIAVLPTIRKQLTDIENGTGLDLETRQVNLAIPKLYWDTFEKVAEVFQLREDFRINNKQETTDQVQDNVIKSYRAATELALSEILMSQFMLDTVIGFAVHVAQAQLISKIQDAIESKDPELLLQMLTNLQGRSLNEPDDTDDDTEN